MADLLAQLREQEAPVDLLAQLDALNEGREGPPQAQQPQGAFPLVTEFASAVNRGLIDVADFFTTDQVNSILSLSGSEKRIPAIADIPFVKQATAGGFLEPGVGRDIVQAAGEAVGPGSAIGGALRATAKALPTVAAAAQSVGGSIVRQLGKTTLASDLGFSAVSGAGAAAGESVGDEEGAIIGSILAPVAASAVVPAIKGLFKTGAKGIQSLAKSLESMSDDAASTLLAEQLVREGMSPDDAIKRMVELGPEALPADIGNNFARLLRTASNKIPRVEGQATTVLDARQSGQGNRILHSLDDATGTSTLTVDDEIARINTVLGPQVDELYRAARAKPFEFTTRLNNLFKGKTDISAARKSAQVSLNNRKALGEEVTDLDIIDATKKQLDDKINVSIRKGRKEKARELIRLKKILIEDVDNAVPEYKEARNLFAGKANMENAAETGELFFRLKPRELDAFASTLSDSEMKMFKLGAKQAVVDRINDLNVNADVVRRLFSKNGDVSKLKTLFQDENQFNAFNETLKREADFVLTRRAAQANSTTAKQLSDDLSSQEILSSAAESITSPVGAARVLTKFKDGHSKRKGSAAYTRALEKAGDILLAKGMTPEKIQELFRKGSAQRIREVFEEAIGRELKAPKLVPGVVAGILQTEGTK